MTPLNPVYDERGLLGLAFHPDFTDNLRFFAYYSVPPEIDTPPRIQHVNPLVEFTASDNPDLANHLSQRIVLEKDWPQPNHDGGTLALGPDGYLYVSMRDGGGANDNDLGHVDDWHADDAGGNGQDVEPNLLGNLLKIGMNGALPYGIPADNPFVGRPGLDENWASGFRNPYRYSIARTGG